MTPCVIPAQAHEASVNVSWERKDASQQHASQWLQALGVVASAHEPWGAYLQSVYGDTVEFPVDLRRLRSID